jgi:predicted nucleic acid-binding protein
VRWLLDVNAIVALAHQGHANHHQMIRWYASLMNSEARLVTTPITEIGFARVSVHAGFERNVSEAVETISGLKQSSRIPFDFLTDTLGVNRLPDYVIGAKQITDGHLLELAKEASIQLATLDKSIPGAFVIP